VSLEPAKAGFCVYGCSKTEVVMALFTMLLVLFKLFFCACGVRYA
jgi:hypothetical protein